LVPSETILADDEGNELMLTTPVMALKFESITRLVALATQRAGKDGVYRGITPDHTSVFIAFTLPDALDPLPFDSAQGELALEHARAYDTESFGIDRSFHERSAGLEPVESIDLMEELLLEKKAIFDRFWAKNDEWAPASFSWPSDHDLSCSVHRFAGPARDGGCIVVKILGRSRRLVYRLEETDDGARIVDQLIEWGDGFVWPA